MSNDLYRGSWSDDDLNDILALLDKDYTKPQTKSAPAAEDELSELKNLLDKDYTKPQVKSAPAADDELSELKNLLDKDYTKPKTKAKPFLPQKQEEAIFDEEPQGFDPVLTFHRQKMGALEQADFEERPAGKQKGDFWLIPLAVLAVAELLCIGGVVVWWMQWL